MTLLLDTHAFLWWLDDPHLLSHSARKAIADGRNTVYISAAVAWEIAIKQFLGELDAPDDLEAVMQANRFLPLPVTVSHALAVRNLPGHHRDPFDRLLIAQARQERFKLVTRDLSMSRRARGYRGRVSRLGRSGNPE
jgi:PIN domain nuclease of toxin-antitoxin system